MCSAGSSAHCVAVTADVIIDSSADDFLNSVLIVWFVKCQIVQSADKTLQILN